MCLIIIKPKGVDLPSDIEILNAHICHSDGFGLAYNDGSDATIKKGAMGLADIFKILRSVDYPEQRDIIMHFRTGTTGSNTPSNCHPFPLSHDVDALNATELKTRVAVAHNGVLTEYSEYSRREILPDIPKDFTDTAAFIYDVLSQLGEKTVLSKPFRKLICTGYQNLAFLTPTAYTWAGRFWSYEERLYTTSLITISHRTRELTKGMLDSAEFTPKFIQHLEHSLNDRTLLSSMTCDLCRRSTDVLRRVNPYGMVCLTCSKRINIIDKRERKHRKGKQNANTE